MILKLPAKELWNESSQEFVNFPSVDLELEHSLFTMDQWESKWHRPFLSIKDKTDEELKSYIRFMIQSISDPSLNVEEVIDYLSNDDLRKINDFINDPMTATTIQRKGKKSGSGSRITSEVIYSNMFAFRIPLECQHWHLNKLLTLIEVCDIKQNPQEKMSVKETMLSNAELNARNRERFHISG